jgi:hypothetical protein
VEVSELTCIKPVRVNGKPAKHLERPEHFKVTRTTLGWFNKKVTEDIQHDPR